MKQQLYIPKRINVGFNERADTYNGLLGYVIYWDDKGKLRKEASWESWRHKVGEKKRYWDNKSNEVYGENVAPRAFDNVPTEGFVLNKGVGGQRESWGWNARNEYIRVYDPRGFEFEISVANLLFILQHTSAIKGKGLEGEFVYSWEGKDLILLPVDCFEYRASNNFTNLQVKKISAKEMEVGHTYLTKKEEEVIYIGRYHWYERTTKYHRFKSTHVGSRDYIYARTLNVAKKHIFWDVKNNKFVSESGFTHLAKKTGTSPVDNFAELIDKLMASTNGHSPIGVISNIIKPTLSTDDYNKIIVALENEDKTHTIYGIIPVRNNYGYSYGHRNYVKGYILIPLYDFSYKNGPNMTLSTKEFVDKIYAQHELESLTFKDLSLQLEGERTLKLVEN